MRIFLPLILLFSGCAARIILVAETSDAIVGKVKIEKEQKKEDAPTNPITAIIPSLPSP